MSAPSISRPTRGALLGLHALTALHPGAGAALGVVDLPVQRERHTQWPTIAGSALKGVLRDHCRDHITRDGDLDNLERWDDDAKKPADRKGTHREKADNTILLSEMFGPPTAGSDKFGGAVTVTDARLLAFPVRSLKGIFAWVTCPEALHRLKRDAHLAGHETTFSAPQVRENQVVVPQDCPCLVKDDNRECVVLEEFEMTKASGNSFLVASWIARHLLAAEETHEGFLNRLLILSDDDFTHFVRHATEVTARIGLDYNTKTVKNGALFYQEFLPSETLFYSVVLAQTSRSNGHARNGPPHDLLERLRGYLPSKTVMQIGGDETTGKGFCAVRLSESGGKS